MPITACSLLRTRVVSQSPTAGKISAQNKIERRTKVKARFMTLRRNASKLTWRLSTSFWLESPATLRFQTRTEQHPRTDWTHPSRRRTWSPASSYERTPFRTNSAETAAETVNHKKQRAHNYRPIYSGASPRVDQGGHVHSTFLQDHSWYQRRSDDFSGSCK